LPADSWGRRSKLESEDFDEERHADISCDFDRPFIAGGAAISFTIGWRPFIGPKMRAASTAPFERTPQRLARGRYLVVGLAGCESCHSQKDWKSHGAPNLPGMEMAGQEIPIDGLPGRIVASNVTPDEETGAGRWTDGEMSRAIREGIGHDGRTIFPMMPYSEYRDFPMRM